MNKTLIALAAAGFAVASVNAAPQANTFYAGAKAGWASLHHDINALDHKQGGAYGINRNSITYGVFGGYQIIDNLAFELGYDYFGRVRGNMQDVRALKHTMHGTTLALKGNYELINGLDTYAKLGTALVRNDAKNYLTNSNSHHLDVAVLLGAGVEYELTPSLAARVEYQWLRPSNDLSKAGRKLLKKDHPHDLYGHEVHSVSAGLTYRFGQAAPAIGPDVITKRFAFNSDVLFDFGKSNLKADATAVLDAAYSEIQALTLASPTLVANGYTDRIGKDASNLALSQRRAESVANYMVAKGIEADKVTAVGYGKANPVTGNTCDSVKGRSALVACLAPDRRVELQVEGTKEVVM